MITENARQLIALNEMQLMDIAMISLTQIQKPIDINESIDNVIQYFIILETMD